MQLNDSLTTSNAGLRMQQINKLYEAKIYTWRDAQNAFDSHDIYKIRGIGTMTISNLRRALTANAGNQPPRSGRLD